MRAGVQGVPEFGPESYLPALHMYGSMVVRTLCLQCNREGLPPLGSSRIRIKGPGAKSEFWGRIGCAVQM